MSFFSFHQPRTLQVSVPTYLRSSVPMYPWPDPNDEVARRLKAQITRLQSAVKILQNAPGAQDLGLEDHDLDPVL